MRQRLSVPGLAGGSVVPEDPGSSITLQDLSAQGWVRRYPETGYGRPPAIGGVDPKDEPLPSARGPGTPCGVRLPGNRWSVGREVRCLQISADCPPEPPAREG